IEDACISRENGKLGSGDRLFDGLPQDAEDTETQGFLVLHPLKNNLADSERDQPVDIGFHKKLSLQTPQPIDENIDIAFRGQFLEGPGVSPSLPTEDTHLAPRDVPERTKVKLMFERGTKRLHQVLEQPLVRR